MRYTPHYVIGDPDEGNNTGHSGRMLVLAELAELVEDCEKRMSQSLSLRVGEPAVVERIVRNLEGDGAHSSAALATEMRRANSVAR